VNKQGEFPNAPQGALLTVALFVLTVFAGVVMGGIAGRGPGTLAVLSLAAPAVATALLLAWVLKQRQLSVAGLLHPAKHSVGATLAVLTIPVVLIVPALLLALSVANSVLVSVYPMSDRLREAFEQAASSGTTTFLFVCLIGPVLEESLFRGVILRGFLSHYPRAWAILGSALLFGAVHLNIYQFVTATSLGIVSGWLYERSRSLWPSIILHSAFNTISVYGLTALLKAQGPAGAEQIGPPLVLFSIISGAIGFRLLRKFLAPTLPGR
jgi:uncharacterized protein